MIETIHLQPPTIGPCSNPVLFAIAEAIAGMLPLAVLPPDPAAVTPAPMQPAAEADAADVVARPGLVMF